MHKRTLSRIRRTRISKTEDSTDTPYDLFVRRSPRKRDIAFWCAFLGGMVAGIAVAAFRTVR